jgi:hypothetical protein
MHGAMAQTKIKRGLSEQTVTFIVAHAHLYTPVELAEKFTCTLPQVYHISKKYKLIFRERYGKPVAASQTPAAKSVAKPVKHKLREPPVLPDPQKTFVRPPSNYSNPDYRAKLEALLKE